MGTARVARVAQDRQQPILGGAADSAWSRLVSDAPGGLYTTISDRGIAAFSSPLAALAFAVRARKALSGPTSIPLGYLGEAIEVPQGVVCSVGLSVGEIRGGTDGARLTEMGLPTPNLFTGGMNYHSRTEWVALPAMVRASLTVVELAGLWADHTGPEA